MKNRIKWGIHRLQNYAIIEKDLDINFLFCLCVIAGHQRILVHYHHRHLPFSHLEVTIRN